MPSVGRRGGGIWVKCLTWGFFNFLITNYYANKRNISSRKRKGEERYTHLKENHTHRFATAYQCLPQVHTYYLHWGVKANTGNLGMKSGYQLRCNRRTYAFWWKKEDCVRGFYSSLIPMLQFKLGFNLKFYVLVDGLLESEIVIFFMLMYCTCNSVTMHTWFVQNGLIVTGKWGSAGSKIC